MRQFPPETNRYITSARERERKKKKKLFSLFLEKHKFFFLEWCASCSTALGTLIWGICVNKQAKLLQRWCSLVKRGQLTRMQEFSGCCSNTVGCLLLLIFWRNLLSTPPTSLPPSPPASLFRISRRQELWRDKCILAEPKEKNRGGKAYRWWRWRGEPWLEGWREESRRTASRWPRRCSGRWWSSEHLDGESTRREKPQQDVQMCMTVWMTEQKLS